jgi:CRISPR-associated exonuclease Cas4
MFAESDLIPLSALQHFVGCSRQCALIHLKSVWIEDERTAEGRIEHERVDRGGAETRGPLRRAYGVPLRSLRLGFAGRADVVEFHAMPGGGPERPFPVEHKRGRPKIGDEDRVQLCAQALVSGQDFRGSPPARGRGLKPDLPRLYRNSTRFAARAGARIENYTLSVVTKRGGPPASI